MAQARPPAGRRKIRKGTLSCWECKRRKVKCTFATSNRAICDSCIRRGSSCITQEYPDTGASTQTRQIGERIGRVEALIQQLIRDDENSSVVDEVPVVSPDQGYFTQNDTIIQARSSIADGMQNILQQSERVPLSTPLLQHQVEEDEVLINALITAWPDKHDLDIICAIPIDIPSCVRGFQPSQNPSCNAQTSSSMQATFKLPPAGSHPVLYAQRLVMLGICLQAIPTSHFRERRQLSIDHRLLMSRAIDTVHCLVTSKDELLDSIEAVSCIAIEAMYYNNAGNLRKAWLTLRRAITIAQVLGFHRRNACPSGKMLDGRAFVDAALIWFRLVQTDRYLSLMLGLPQATAENNLLPAEGFVGTYSPSIRLHQVQCSVGGLILQRNEEDIADLEATMKIDKLLQTAYLSFSPEWWLMPSTSSRSNDIDGQTRSIDRFMDQLTHYHLTARLHLPYLLRPANARQYEYSKLTAVNASREVLMRFIAFHDSKLTSSYCRGIEFLAFIACITLCIAHSDAHRQSEDSITNSDRSPMLSSLAHQYHTDRATMERAVRIVDNMANEGEDHIALSIAMVLRQLLIIENYAATGKRCCTSLFLGKENASGCGGQISNGGSTLKMFVPFLGVIKLESDDLSRSDSLVAEYNENLRTIAHPESSRITDAGSDLIRSLPDNSNPDGSRPMSGNGTDQGEINTMQSPIFEVEPDMGLEILQGVDMAFFDSVVRGSKLLDFENALDLELG